MIGIKPVVRLTVGNRIVTINDMKLFMDADCLIKLTKAGLNELVCRHDTVMIPDMVRQEVVDSGKVKGCDDAVAVEKNISADFISVLEHSLIYKSGDSDL